MAFDPSKPFSVVEEKENEFPEAVTMPIDRQGSARSLPQFDPTKPFEVIEEVKPFDLKKYGIGVGREFATGASFGAYPLAEAKIRSSVGDETFEEARSKIQQEREQFGEEHPVEYYGADAAGGLLTGSAVAKGAAKLGVKGLAKAASVIGEGALEGGLRSASSGKDPVEGAAIGATLSGIAGGAANRLQKMLKNAERTADMAVFKFLNPSKGQYSKKRALQVGRVINDEIDIGPGTTRGDIQTAIRGSGDAPEIDESLVSSIDPSDLVGSRGGLIGKYGKEIDDIINETAAAYKKTTGQELTHPGEEISRMVKHKIVQKIDTNSLAASKADLKLLDRELEFLASRKNLTLPDLQKLKKAYSKKLSPSDFMGDSGSTIKEFRKEIYLDLKGLVEGHMDNISSIVGSKEKLGKFIRNQNQKISKLLTADEILSGKKGLGGSVAADELRRSVTLPAATAGLAAIGTTANPVMGAVAFGGAKMLENYGAQSAISVMNTLNKYKIPRTAAGILKNKELVIGKLMAAGAPTLASEVQKTIDDQPNKISRFIPMLLDQLPDVFENAAFASEFDGKIHNEQDKQIYIKEVEGDDQLSNTQKAKTINTMLKTGQITYRKPAIDPVGQTTMEDMEMELGGIR